MSVIIQVYIEYNSHDPHPEDGAEYHADVLIDSSNDSMLYGLLGYEGKRSISLYKLRELPKDINWIIK